MFKLIFHPEASTEIQELDSPLKEQTAKQLVKLQNQGNVLRYPDTDIIKGSKISLFELRSGKTNISRTFFVYEKDRTIYILRCFVKKTPKTPKQEIALAERRLQEILSNE